MSSKIIWNYKGPRITKLVFKKLTWLNFNAYNKAIITQCSIGIRINIQISGEAKNSEINSHIYGQLISAKMLR